MFIEALDRLTFYRPNVICRELGRGGTKSLKFNYNQTILGQRCIRIKCHVNARSHILVLKSKDQ